MQMASHPLNLLIRFLLEIAALIAMGIWGWQLSDSWIRYVAAIGIPLSLVSIWGIFAVPGDPSRSGGTIVKTPGFIRLAYELLFFGFGVFALYDSAFKILSLIMGLILILHYLFSIDRIIWLTNN